MLTGIINSFFKIDNSYNIENNQNDFFNYLVNLIEHKSQYKLKAFPYVKNIFKGVGKIIVLITTGNTICGENFTF